MAPHPALSTPTLPSEPRPSITAAVIPADVVANLFPLPKIVFPLGSGPAYTPHAPRPAACRCPPPPADLDTVPTLTPPPSPR
jgi:hypothetical protein